MAIKPLKQAHLAGRLKGLRPSQQKRLANISHRRHFSTGEVDIAILELLAQEVLNLQKSLHLIIDARGLCKLLWVGPLDKSQNILSHLPDSPRKKLRSRRLISCQIYRNKEIITPHQKDATIALGLDLISWLIFDPSINKNRQKNAYIFKPNSHEISGWTLVTSGKLNEILKRDKSSIETKNLKADHNIKATERVLLLIQIETNSRNSERHLSELESLVRSAGVEPVAVAQQKKGGHNPQTIWGIGKLQEVALEIRRHKVSLVITDRELTPAQARNLEEWLDCAVADRSELILDIFAQRASSSAGRLQVELAQLRYRLPRLIGRGHSLSRQGGGIGTRGPGETQLEKDKRAIARRIKYLIKEMKQIEQHRVRLRKGRQGIPKIALVGYTNAGKSSLLNALCPTNKYRQVHTENKLFATLDPTTRRLTLPRQGLAPYELLITDTVGFIQELPDTLLEAFRATLEETLEANLILIVVDLGDHHWPEQLKTVNYLLDSIGTKSNRQLVANQIDRCNSSEIDAVHLIDPKVIYISAISGAGIQGLKNSLLNQFWSQEA